MNIKERIQNKRTTIGGQLVGLLTGSIGAAASQFQQTGNVTSWQPYAAAAVGYAVPAIIGALMKDKKK